MIDRMNASQGIGNRRLDIHNRAIIFLPNQIY